MADVEPGRMGSTGWGPRRPGHSAPLHCAGATMGASGEQRVDRRPVVLHRHCGRGTFVRILSGLGVELGLAGFTQFVRLLLEPSALDASRVVDQVADTDGVGVRLVVVPVQTVDEIRLEKVVPLNLLSPRGNTRLVGLWRAVVEECGQLEHLRYGAHGFRCGVEIHWLASSSASSSSAAASQPTALAVAFPAATARLLALWTKFGICVGDHESLAVQALSPAAIAEGGISAVRHLSIWAPMPESRLPSIGTGKEELKACAMR